MGTGILTQKQEAFVLELLKGKTQREAYKAAYNVDKMSERVMDVRACELLKVGKVKVRYEELRSKVVQKAEEQAIMTALDVLREIEKIAQDDISNYLDFRTEKTVVGYDNGEPVFDYRTIVEMKDSRTIDTKNVAEVSVGVNGSFKFKNYSRDTALYKLAELLGADVLRKAKHKLAEDALELKKQQCETNNW